ncbi:P-loop containing nucleoside triphosphate hydrolase [Vigna unguiculata]|uniref:P-loop containing nucleoside triphosphate hydrolase n=1 Tax=Vigna unguiculata TaxID=3917 RepID=A0A4D6M5Y8_VIGUN|nr:P-loop containing nucleoside triphosphate hydrolase [Vigna unguiculata]
MEKISLFNEEKTLVLVGRIGNGKSTIGNSILGRNAFKLRTCSSSESHICELQKNVTKDGSIINVINTPGLFDGSDSVGKEIIECIDLAKDGIHAILVVFSVRTRFSEEEEATLRVVQTLFGHKITDYMILVFTGGDELEYNEETLEDYLGGCPQPLKLQSEFDTMEKISLFNEEKTLVLVGRIGNGKSTIGNSILGRNAFKLRTCSSSESHICELQKNVTKDGSIINVINTPGLFDGSDSVGKEIIECIDLAKDGIHAILVVFSVRTRFSEEEEATLRVVQTLFGHKITDYMILVFTGGDELEYNEETLEDYLGGCPQPLKDILLQCDNRKVLFDNKTKDEKKQLQQVQQLMNLVNMVMSKNNGQPYTNKTFVRWQEGSQLKEEIANLLETLEEERVQRLMIEEKLKLAQASLNDEIQKLRYNHELANTRPHILQQLMSMCGIL